MPVNLAEELRVAVAAVREAMKICRRVQQAITPDVLDKDDHSPVTVADFASQAVVCRLVGDAFPHDPIIAEEDSTALRQPEHAAFLERIAAEFASTGTPASGAEICRWIDRGGAQNYQSRFWTLDPIDGTKGFLRGEQYAVSLALVVDGQVTVAALGCPNLTHDDGDGVVFSAVRGYGATAHPFAGDVTAVPIRVRPAADFATARFCESVESGHSRHDWSAQVAEHLGIGNEPVRMDSQAKYAAVARGDADIYLRLPTRPGYREKIWDHAGGMLIVQEAGGTVTDIDGQPLDFTHGSELAGNRGVVVTGSLPHAAVLEAVQKTRP